MSSYRMKYKIGNTQYHIPVQEDIAGFGSGIPLGTILPYSANSEYPPEGFLWCDGSAISRSAYPDLFALIGTLYGEGDGSTTFNLPDLTDKFIEGSITAGNEKEAGLPNIEGNTDAYRRSNLDRGAFVTVSGTYSVGNHSSAATVDGTLGFDASRSNAIYGNSNTVQPPALTMRYIIKTFSATSSNSELVDVTELSTEITKKFDPSTDFTFVYPNNGTAQNPANITTNSRYVMDNPFPGYLVQISPEVLYSSTWREVPNAIQTGSSSSIGITHEATVDKVGIYTGTSSVMLSGGQGLSSVGAVSSAPCRIKVWKIGKLPQS